MSQLKCCMCNEEMSDYGTVIAHMTKFHNMNFADKDDMNRRLQAVGFDPIVEKPVVPPRNLQSLHG